MSEHRGGTKSSRIVVRAQSSVEAFSYICYLASRLDFYRRNGYQAVLPDHAGLRGLYESPSSVSSEELLRLKRIFVDSVYRAKDVTMGVRRVSEQVAVIESCCRSLIPYVDAWKFDLRSSYNVTLTSYGTGGSYDVDSGTILVRTTRDGTLRRRDAAHTVVHELVHIGIQRAIVERFGLSHNEKETVVDAMCSVGLADELPGYVVQKRADAELLRRLDREALLNLPSILEGRSGGHS